MFQETNIVLKVTNFSWRMFKCKEAMCYRSFPGGTVVKRHGRRRRHRLDSWVGKILWSRNGNPLQYFLPGKFHWQRSLAGLHGVAKSWTWLTGHVCMLNVWKRKKEQGRAEPLRLLSRKDVNKTWWKNHR